MFGAVESGYSVSASIVFGTLAQALEFLSLSPSEQRIHLSLRDGLERAMYGVRITDISTIPLRRSKQSTFEVFV